MNSEAPQPESLEPSAFSSLVLSIAAAALAYMGHDVIPGAEKFEKNLALARQSIDTLVMLQLKTEGNRTPAETKLLDELLFQLRAEFVKAS
jgi:hypothetical protein